MLNFGRWQFKTMVEYFAAKSDHKSRYINKISTENCSIQNIHGSEEYCTGIKHSI